MRRWLWLPLGLAAVVALLVVAAWATGGGEGGGSEAEAPLPPAEEAPISAEPPGAGDELEPSELPASNRLEDRFSPIVTSHRGRNYLVPGEIIEGEGFEFVLGAPREDLERVASVTVRFPDGETTRDLSPSTQLGTPLDFFGYYGTGEGLPSAGDYVFEIAMKDGTQLKAVNQFDGMVLDLPENVTADIDREAGTITVTWDPVASVRNYTVGLQDVMPDSSYKFVENVGCPDPDIVNPGALGASYWTQTYCEMADLNSYLRKGKRYGIQIAVWSDFSYGGVDGAVLFTW